jgi:type VI secretion system secreted protein Hcp
VKSHIGQGRRAHCGQSFVGGPEEISAAKMREGYTGVMPCKEGLSMVIHSATRLTSALFAATLAAFLLALPQVARAELDVTIEMSMNGAAISFPNPNPARPDQIPVEGFSMGLGVSFSPTTGLPNGTRQHQPLVVVKRVDVTTPLLLQALIESQTILATIRFYSASDPVTPYFQIRITAQGRIIGVKDAAGGGDEVPTEAVSLTYGTIEWEHSSGTVFTDSWTGS